MFDPPPPPPPPKPLFDQDAEPPPVIATRPVYVYEAAHIAAQYTRRVRLLNVFAATFALTLLLAAVFLTVRWLLDNPAPYNDPEPPVTTM